jgi:acetyl-CoA synthetase
MLGNRAALWECIPSEEVARSIFEHSHAHLAAYKRIRRLEFAELPKTISRKICRVDLSARELDLREQTERARAENEYWEEDFPDLRTAPTR